MLRSSHSIPLRPENVFCIVSIICNLTEDVACLGECSSCPGEYVARWWWWRGYLGNARQIRLPWHMQRVRAEPGAGPTSRSSTCKAFCPLECSTGPKGGKPECLRNSRYGKACTGHSALPSDPKTPLTSIPEFSWSSSCVLFLTTSAGSAMSQVQKAHTPQGALR